MPRRGWDAKGKLEAVWAQLDPPVRETLADLMGLKNAAELSARNSGDRPLTTAWANRVITGAAKAGVTVSYSDLGEPVPEPEVRLTLDCIERRLGAIEDALRESEDVVDQLRGLNEQVQRLERRVQRGNRRAEK